MKKQNKSSEQQPSQNGESLSPARRKLLGGMAVTGAAVWHAPVIKSVVTPAHAQTSQSLQTFFLAGGVDIAKHTPSLLDAVIPTANAGNQATSDFIDFSSIQAELVETSSGQYNLTLYAMFDESTGRFVNADGLFMASGLTIGGEGDLINIADPCMFLERSGSAGAFAIQLDSVSDDQAEVTLITSGATVPATLLPGPGNLPTPSCQLNAASVYTERGLSLGEGVVMQTPTDSLLDLIAPAAYAGFSGNGSGDERGNTFSIQVIPTAGTLMAAVTVVVDGEGTYTGNVSMLSGDLTDLSLEPCSSDVANSNTSQRIVAINPSLSMFIDSFNVNEMFVGFGGGSRLSGRFNTPILAGEGLLPDPFCGSNVVPIIPIDN